MTLTINAIDPEIGARVYAWVRPDRFPLRGAEGATLLRDRQLDAIRKLKQHDVVVKVNTIVIPSVNEDHVVEIARTVSELGADILNCIPLYPVENTPFAELPQPSTEQIAELREQVAPYMPLMHHCTRCRADAAGLLGEAMQDEQLADLQYAATIGDGGRERPHIAVASEEGVLVNQHLGEAAELAIFGQGEHGYELLEHRTAPTPGTGPQRWERLAELLGDCQAVLVSSAGDAPVSVLGRHGIRVVMMEGLIEEGLDAVFENRELRAPLRREHRCGAGAGCGGDGTGCG